MAISKPDVAELRTRATIQTNLNKQVYGYTKTGAGYLDGYTTWGTTRGKFYQRKAEKAIGTGAVLTVAGYVFICRFSTGLSNIVDPQMRFLIKSKTYTLESFDINIWDRAEYFVFKLKEFN